MHPVFFGSAITGAGVQPLTAGLAELLPAAAGDADGPVSGRVFKIERGPPARRSRTSGCSRERCGPGTGCVRSRPARPRQRSPPSASSTAVRARMPRPVVVRRQIGKLWGLADGQIGDPIGQRRPGGIASTSSLRRRSRSVVVPRNPGDRGRLRVALDQLAEQDPLINVRQNDAARDVRVALRRGAEGSHPGDAGERLRHRRRFRETTTIYVERPIGLGEAVELLGAPGNPFPATLGLRIEPAPAGSGVAFRPRSTSARCRCTSTRRPTASPRS